MSIEKDGIYTKYRRNIIGKSIIEEGQLQYDEYREKIRKINQRLFESKQEEVLDYLRKK